MMDRCTVMRRVELDTDDYGYEIEAWAAVAESECGLDMTAQREVMDETEVALTDARLRLPLAMEGMVENLDRFRIDERFGVELAVPPTYEILGQARRGPSGLVYNLKLVTDGSDE